jgi:hypothetical protein
MENQTMGIRERLKRRADGTTTGFWHMQKMNGRCDHRQMFCANWQAEPSVATGFAAENRLSGTA